jgi:hypothetical protein
VSISESRKSRAETLLIVSRSRRTQRRPVGTAMPHGHPFRVNTTNLAAVDFCIWRRVLRRFRPFLAMRVRKPIRRGRLP